MDRLLYFPGSPFARMARVLIIEWSLQIRCEELAFPPDDNLFLSNPLGQVPVLIADDGRTYAPSLIVLERLWDMAGKPPGTYSETERQTLLTLLQAGDALAAAKYQHWTGLEPVGPNRIGYDPAERNLLRFERVLRWYADRPQRQDMNLCEVAMACIVLWAAARGSPEYRNLPGLADRVRALESRASFQATMPPAW